MAAAPAGQATAAVATSAAVNGAVGAAGSGVSHLSQHGWKVENGWDFAGALAGGGFAGAVGGLAGPAGGTLARLGGQAATSGLATAGTAAISGLGASGGSMVSDAAAGRPVNPTHALLCGAFGAGASTVPVSRIPGMGQNGVSTLQQMPYFAPRTVPGALNFTQPNSVGLWGGTSGGAAVGFGGDALKDAIGW